MEAGAENVDDIFSPTHELPISARHHEAVDGRQFLVVRRSRI